MLKSFKKPTMLAAGCSFTDAAFTSIFHPDWDFSYDKWPAHVARSLKLKHENIGLCGLGNPEIANRIMDYLYENPQIEYLFVLWSGYDRFASGNYHHCPQAILTQKYEEENSGGERNRGKLRWEAQKELADKDWSHRDTAFRLENLIPFYKYYMDAWWDYEKIVTETHRAFYMVQKECERRNIKYMFMQGPTPIAAYSIKEMANGGYLKGEHWRWHNVSKMGTSKYANELEDTCNFVGWPGFDLLGGYSASTDSRFERVSDVDGHPSKNAHKLIAEVFMEEYEKAYS